MTTKTDKLRKGLVVMGYLPVPSRSGKFEMFEKPGVRFPYLFLGKSAALRGNSKPCITGSYSLTDATKQMFIMKGEA
jgi:hypothetical protein